MLIKKTKLCMKDNLKKVDEMEGEFILSTMEISTTETGKKVNK